MVRIVERLMEAREMGINLNPDEMSEVFAAFDPAEHAAEAESRWGETDAYRESQRRTAQYGKDDWLRIKAEAESIDAQFTQALADGLSPDGDGAMDIAEQHRQHISRWFYHCSYAVHRGLGEMYASDPRFSAHYDERATGLSDYVRAAIAANAERAAGH